MSSISPLLSFTRFRGPPGPLPHGDANGRNGPALHLAPLAARYRRLDWLGAGAHGTVHLLERRDRGDLVVAKVARSSRHARTAILNEVRMLSAAPADVVHPLRGLIVDAGRICGYITAHVDGETVAARLGRGRVSPEESDALAREAVDVVLRLHRAGIFHCDLKPAHFFLPRPCGPMRVLDLGLARGAGVARQRRDGLFCTPLYASPEQIAGRPVRLDERSDLFSLGLVLYEIATGERFFRPATGDGDVERFRKTRAKRLAAPLALPADAPAFVRALIERLLVADPSRRASDDEVERLLREWPAGKWGHS